MRSAPNWLRFLLLSYIGMIHQRQELGYEVKRSPSNALTYSPVRCFQQKPKQVDCVVGGAGELVAYLSDAEVDRFYTAVGSRVRRARAGRGMSQSALAKQIGFTRSSVANLEAGRQKIALHLLVQIARALGCEPAALIPEVTVASSVDDAVLEELTEHLDEPAREFVRRAVGRLVSDTEREGT
jgi:transcriptional regulator with XRE-family HTH domain